MSKMVKKFEILKKIFFLITQKIFFFSKNLNKFSLFLKIRNTRLDHSSLVQANCQKKNLKKSKKVSKNHFFLFFLRKKCYPLSFFFNIRRTQFDQIIRPRDASASKNATGCPKQMSFLQSD